MANDGDRVEVWDRVMFRGNVAVHWHQSTDYGKTWVPVNWLGPRLPFVMIGHYAAPRDLTVKATVAKPILMLPEHVEKI